MERREVVNASKESGRGAGRDSSASKEYGWAGPGDFGSSKEYSSPASWDFGASKEYDQPGEWTFTPPEVEPISQVTPTQFPSEAAGSQSAGSLFPASQSANRLLCLYFGPAGERCYRPAQDNGFCPRHQPNASPTAPRDESRARKKKAVATVGIIAALWPLVEELLRQIFRLLR